MIIGGINIMWNKKYPYEMIKDDYSKEKLR